jgi:LAGLIDADG endonuclease
MLERLCISRYDSVRSGRYRDNVMGAENQQERLIQVGWVIGFVDGEGCFSIGFVRQHDRAGRKGYKTGYQVAHEFAVTQGAKSASCLDELVAFFEVGSIIANKRYDNHKEHLYRYVVRRRKDLIETIIPFFLAHPMHSSKQRDFEKFARCVEMIDAGVHRTHQGLADIAEITQTMNRQKPRQDLIRILRDHTPEVQDTGS